MLHIALSRSSELDDWALGREDLGCDMWIRGSCFHTSVLRPFLHVVGQPDLSLAGKRGASGVSPTSSASGRMGAGSCNSVAVWLPDL